MSVESFFSVFSGTLDRLRLAPIMNLRTNKPRLPDSSLRVQPKKPTPGFERPVLVIPGGTSRKDGLPTTLHYLTHGGNNQYGGSIRADQLDSFERYYHEHGGNVFALEYTREFGSFETTPKRSKALFQLFVNPPEQRKLTSLPSAKQAWKCAPISRTATTACET